MGDGFMFGSGQADNLAGLARLEGYLDVAGRDRSSFGIEAFLNFQAGPDQWRAEVEAWQAVNADYVSMRGMALRGQGGGMDSPQAHIDALRTYWEVVGDLAG